MIILENNKRLKFVFPEIAAELTRLSNAEVERLTDLYEGNEADILPGNQTFEPGVIFAEGPQRRPREVREWTDDVAGDD